MAAPVIETYSSGSVETTNNYTFNITLPTGLSSGDIIFGFICAGTSHAAFIINEANSSSNFNQDKIWSFYPGDNFDISCGYVYTSALSSGNTLQIQTAYYGYDGKPITGSMQYSKVSYVFYRISGAFISDCYIVYTLGHFANWNPAPVPLSDDSDVKDYLWLIGAGSSSNLVATVAPSTYGSLITKSGTSSIPYTASISSCSKTTLSTISRDDPGVFTAPVSDWISYSVRLHPSNETPPPLPPPPGSDGFMIPLYNKKIYKIADPTLEVLPDYQRFNPDATPYYDNHFDSYIQVTSTGPWTASWNDGLFFYASAYSGSEGIEYISINCLYLNNSGSTYTDTLIFDGPGITTASVNVEQYSS